MSYEAIDNSVATKELQKVSEQGLIGLGPVLWGDRSGNHVKQCLEGGRGKRVQGHQLGTVVIQKEAGDLEPEEESTRS